MKVLSLFDGMSCGRLALDRAGIPVSKYYASEIDKHAMAVSRANYPDIIQLGSVIDLAAREINGHIDLLIGGSPCQGFSFAGKQLNFSDPRSKLFFKYVEILKKVKPTYFLLENVKMKKEYQDVISKILGVEPIEINSALVSAQNRKRLYWTNIPGVTQPKDKGILLKDIIDFSKNTSENYLDLSKYSNVSIGYINKNTKTLNEKSNSLGTGVQATANGTPVIKIDGFYRILTPTECERLQTVPDNYTACVVKTARHSILGNGWTVDVIAHILSFIPR